MPRNEDPWKHRSKGMRCRTCMWYVEKAHEEHRLIKPGVLESLQSGTKELEDLKEADFVFPKPRAVGRCRRRAPTMNGYPVVFEHDWCGDHKLDEGRI